MAAGCLRSSRRMAARHGIESMSVFVTLDTDIDVIPNPRSANRRHVVRSIRSAPAMSTVNAHSSTPGRLWRPQLRIKQCRRHKLMGAQYQALMENFPRTTQLDTQISAPRCTGLAVHEPVEKHHDAAHRKRFRCRLLQKQFDLANLGTCTERSAPHRGARAAM